MGYVDKEKAYDAFLEFFYEHQDMQRLKEELQELEADAEVKLLEQEPCEDCISRAELLKAIDTWDKFGCDADTKLVPYKDHYVPYIHYDDVIKCIKGMPSVQPKTEQEPKTDYKAFADWVAREVIDEENWEWNSGAFPEVACRKLNKLRIVDTDGNKWIYEGECLEQEPKTNYKNFAEWVASEIFDEYWEYNKDGFEEIACRKLAKLGLVKAEDDKWVRTEG